VVTNNNDEYVGILPLTTLLTADPTVTVREVMNSEVKAIPFDLPDTEVARIFSEQDLVSAPVVDANGRLIGRITIDDVVDVIIEDAEEAVLAPAGLDIEDDTFAPILRSAPRRILWLSINLLTAFLAAWVIAYGIVQAAVPRFLKKSAGAIAGARAAQLWGFVLTVLCAAIAVALQADFHPATTVLIGLSLFGVVFAVNSSVHSYLILAYAGSEKAAEDVGFYYAANALGRFFGTLLSGLLYQWGGLMYSLIGSALMLSACWAVTLALPTRRALPAAAT